MEGHSANIFQIQYTNVIFICRLPWGHGVSRVRIMHKSDMISLPLQNSTIILQLCVTSGANRLSPKKREIKAIIALIPTLWLSFFGNIWTCLGEVTIVFQCKKVKNNILKQTPCLVVFLYKFTALFLPLNEPIMCRTDNNNRHQGHTPTSWQPLKHSVNPHPKCTSGF